MIEQQLFDAPVSKKKERKPKPGCPRCGNQMKPYLKERVDIPVLTKTGRIKFPKATKAQRVKDGKKREEGVKPAEVRIGTKDVLVCGKCVYELGRLV